MTSESVAALIANPSDLATKQAQCTIMNVCVGCFGGNLGSG